MGLSERRQMSRVAVLREMSELIDCCEARDEPTFMKLRTIVETALVPYNRKNDDEIRLEKGHTPKS